jgi:predicted RNA-binding protein
MCEANAFLLKDGQEEMILDNVDEVEVEGDQIRLVNIFGEQRTLKARIMGYNNREGKVLLEAL